MLSSQHTIRRDSVASSINVLDQGIFDKTEEESSAEVKKDEVKVVDITQQQWFWDQAVMS